MHAEMFTGSSTLSLAVKLTSEYIQLAELNPASGMERGGHTTETEAKPAGAG